MDKIVTIGNQEIKFTINASFPIIYKNKFGKDILTIILPIISDLLKGMDDLFTDDKKIEVKPSILGEMLENVYSLEFNTILNVIWTMAYMANKDIEEPVEWLSKFNEFPVIDIVQELAPLFLNSLISKKKLEQIRQLVN